MSINNSELIIESGQSFGFCIGPCLQTLTLSGLKMESEFFVKTTDAKGNQGNSEELNYQDSLSESEWNAIVSSLNLRVFKTLDEVYGCPDCADGGSEWVEIKDNGMIYRVTFEYGEKVKGIEKLILLLRAKRNELSEKYVNWE